MALSRTRAALLCVTLLGGCSFTEQALLPSLTGEDPAGQAPAPGDTTLIPAMAPAVVESQPLVAPVGVTPGQATGTFVGQKVASLRGDLQQLQGTLARHAQSLQGLRTATAQDSQRYHGTVAAINARLQVGTTPGNPVLMQQWYEAQKELDAVGQDIIKMNQLATEVASTSAFASYLLNAVQAARGLSGAVEEDHRQLRILEDEVNRTTVSIDRLLTELAGDVNRQQSYVANEKANLNTLALAIKNGQLYGNSLAVQPPSGGPQMPVAPMASGFGMDAPLVIIRFDKPNPAYEGKLYAAVKEALDRRPGAGFDVVAVTPSRGAAGQTALGSAATRRNAEAVLRTLSSMGLPAERVRLSAMTSDKITAGEVHVFVR